MNTQMTSILAARVRNAINIREASFNRVKAKELAAAGVTSVEGFLPCYDKTIQEAAAEACEADPAQAKPIELMLLGGYKQAGAWADAVLEAESEF